MVLGNPIFYLLKGEYRCKSNSFACRLDCSGFYLEGQEKVVIWSRMEIARDAIWFSEAVMSQPTY